MAPPENPYASKDSVYFKKRRSEMIPFLPARYEVVLEVGCGEGDFGRTLKPTKELWGVEFHQPAAQKASESYTRVLVGRFEEVYSRLPDRHFDLVICNDVIEHMEHPDQFLQAVRSKMRPGAPLIASLPNMRHWKNLAHLLIRKDWKYTDEGIRDKTHLRFFTLKSAARLFRENGFQVEAIRGINTPTIKGAIVSYALTVLTLGYYSDTRFIQIALRARTSE